MADTNFPVDEAELESMLTELADKFADVAKSEARALAKSEGSEGSMNKDEDGSPPEASGGSAPEGSAPSPSAPPSASPSPSAPPAAPSADPAGGAPGADAPASPEELMQAYMSMPPEELQAHMMAAEQAAQQMGLGAPGADAGAPPAGPSPEAAAPPAPPAPPAASPSPAAPPMSPSPQPDMAMKSELESLKNQLKKYEAESADQKKALEVMAKITEKVVGFPMAKAVTGVTYHKYVAPVSAQPLKKSMGEMTPVEIKARLSEIAKNPKLAKSDRDLINQYVVKPDAQSLAALEKLF